MSEQQIRKVDKVTWNATAAPRKARSRRRSRRTRRRPSARCRASEDEPQYCVRSDKSGNDAVHKPEALRKKSK